MHYYFIPTSDQYILPCLNLIETIKKHDKDYYIYIGDLGVSQNNYNLITKTVNLKCKLVSLPNKYLPMIINTKWPKGYLVKLVLPWVIDLRINKILCLGADMLLNNSISELFDLPLDGYAMAACFEMSGNLADDRINLFKNLPADKLYVNAETLMINCTYMREQYSEKFIMEEFCKMQDELEFYDQDFINCLFYKKINVLSPIYNCQLRELSNSEESILGLNNVKIVHYSANPKPWDWKCRPSWIKNYYQLSGEIYKREIYKVYVKSCFLYYPYRVINKIYRGFKRIKKII